MTDKLEKKKREKIPIRPSASLFRNVISRVRMSTFGTLEYAVTFHSLTDEALKAHATRFSDLQTKIWAACIDYNDPQEGQKVAIKEYLDYEAEALKAIARGDDAAKKETLGFFGDVRGALAAQGFSLPPPQVDESIKEELRVAMAKQAKVREQGLLGEGR